MKTRRSLPLLLVALAAPGCRAPTQIVVDVSTDVPCADLRGVTLQVGPPGQLDGRAPASAATACGADGRVGEAVLIPSGDDDAEVAFQLVAGIGQPPDRCAARTLDDGRVDPGPGCVVKRRLLRFLPHETLRVPVLLDASCAGVPCGPAQTCERGVCVSAAVSPDVCASDGGCPVVPYGSSGGASGAGGQGGAGASGAGQAGSGGASGEAGRSGAGGGAGVGGEAGSAGAAGGGAGGEAGAAGAEGGGAGVSGASGHGGSEAGGGQGGSSGAGAGGSSGAGQGGSEAGGQGGSSGSSGQGGGGASGAGASGAGQGGGGQGGAGASGGGQGGSSGAGQGGVAGLGGMAGGTGAAGQVLQVVAGDGHTCVLLVEGAVRCWGDNYHGQLGLGSEQFDDVGDDEEPWTKPTLNMGGAKVKQLAAGSAHTCALLDSGLVKCWGFGQQGQLGTGQKLNAWKGHPGDATPVGLKGKALQIAAGTNHTCALLDGGDVHCWGANSFGQLGLKHSNIVGFSDTPGSYNPVKTEGTVVQLTTGSNHTCSRFIDGTLRCWGDGGYGQLGYASTEKVGISQHPGDMPLVKVGGLVVDLTAAGDHTCGRVIGGDLRCWGSNFYGELGLNLPLEDYVGDDEYPESKDPVVVGGAVLQVVGAQQHTCALLEGGKVRCWGNDATGRLGTGLKGDIGDDEHPGSVDPLPIGQAVQLAAGKDFTCALLASGDLICWGGNGQGQLGLGHENAMGDDETLENVPFVRFLPPGGLRRRGSRQAVRPEHQRQQREHQQMHAGGHRGIEQQEHGQTSSGAGRGQGRQAEAGQGQAEAGGGSGGARGRWRGAHLQAPLRHAWPAGQSQSVLQAGGGATGGTQCPASQTSPVWHWHEALQRARQVPSRQSSLLAQSLSIEHT